MLCTFVCAGVYNEEVWESLDFVLDEASKRNLSLIIPIEVSSSALLCADSRVALMAKAQNLLCGMAQAVLLPQVYVSRVCTALGVYLYAVPLLLALRH